MLDPVAGNRHRASLATGLVEAPGTHAFLLGSGVSHGAGAPTAWDVVIDLILKIAASEGEDLPPDQAEAWWGERTGSRPRYDAVLEEIAPTDGMRQRLLASYFDPSRAGADGLRPSLAHTHIARLVRSGAIRVLLTTNFDRLMEDALIAEGVHPQVIARDSDVRGMVPLQHAPATLVKLHGDYTMLGLRNSERSNSLGTRRGCGVCSTGSSTSTASSCSGGRRHGTPRSAKPSRDRSTGGTRAIGQPCRSPRQKRDI